MSHVRFNYFFITFLTISAICAFLVPVEYSNSVRGWLEGAFAPAAYPVRRVAQLVLRRGRDTTGQGSDFDGSTLSADGRKEIERLRAKVASLTVQLAELRRLHKDRDLVGNAEDYSIPVRVIGTDSSSRHALSLAGTSADGLEAGMPVVYRHFVVGKIATVGGGGSQVRLITDSGFRINGMFARFRGSEYVPIATQPPQVEGRGAGVMAITNLTLKQVQNVRVGDVVQVYDPDDWPTLVNGHFLGRVESIEPHPKSQLFAEITVRPWEDLRQLREVMVVTLRPVAPADTAADAAMSPADDRR